MLAALIVLAIFLFGGLCFTYLFFDEERLLWRLAAGNIVSCAVAGIAGFVITLFFGLTTTTAAVSVLATLLPSAVLFRADVRQKFARDRQRAMSNFQQAQARAAGLFLLVLFYPFLPLLFAGDLPNAGRHLYGRLAKSRRPAVPSRSDLQLYGRAEFSARESIVRRREIRVSVRCRPSDRDHDETWRFAAGGDGRRGCRVGVLTPCAAGAVHRPRDLKQACGPYRAVPALLQRRTRFPFLCKGPVVAAQRLFRISFGIAPRLHDHGSISLGQFDGRALYHAAKPSARNAACDNGDRPPLDVLFRKRRRDRRATSAVRAALYPRRSRRHIAARSPAQPFGDLRGRGGVPSVLHKALEGMVHIRARRVDRCRADLGLAYDGRGVGRVEVHRLEFWLG
ncbi:MAG: hypothetical protein UZ17_ACD001002732 [Acidobacteria bacterium OLB17]|nr:MAG: hypothetical protein UZ17_ACD001002732 [Acidobacteria bacterium OLB17]